jgi:predicted transcriptional regulator
MSELDKLKDEAGKEAKEHPQQVKEGETAVEKKLGMDSKEDQTSQHDQNSAPQDTGGTGQPGS